jgi:glycosyltransferase involved in cell wall biosynthesis
MRTVTVWPHHRSAINFVARLVSSTAHSLPTPARARIRQIVAKRDQRAVISLEDWTRPLIGAWFGPSSPGDLLASSTSVATAALLQGKTGSHEVSMPTGHETPVLRCLVVTGALDVSGVDEVAAFLARRLHAYGFETAAMHATSEPSADGQPRGRLGRMLRAQGIDVREADEAGARRWIERWRPEVISAHHAPRWVLDVAEDLGVPYVENLHGMHDLFGADWRAEADRSRRIAAIVAVSELVRQQYLAGNPGFPLERAITIPNGVDRGSRPRGDREGVRTKLGLTDEYLFVSLARHSLQKNPYGLVTAFANLAQHYQKAHLVIAGRLDDARYCRQVLRLRDSLPCRERIHLRANTGTPAELCAAGDGFVLDSFFEGWSLASMEALSAGLPIVLSDVGGAREQVGNDPSRGYVVSNPLGDPLKVNWESMGAARYRKQVNGDELAAAMERLVIERDHYLQNRESLASESASRFSAEDCLNQHATVLRTVATGAGVSH